ncbi:MAG TPA: TIGR01777 family oxidoreductase [Pyrinomonadaceae bacterium]|nr:TIGR01777 family oxidoreductase [Pyrinomonadaceae bacterium]
MKILISGSHGLVGRALASSLTNDGHEVVRLVRRERVFGSPEVEWDPKRAVIDGQHLEGLTAVIHLAGESIAEGRWTAEKKRRIRESRVQGTQLLSEALGKLSHPPRAFICASAIGFYGSRGDEILTETSAPGTDFLAEVCVEWEKAAQPPAGKGIRIVNLRFGIILSVDGGALAKMLTPFRLGVGGRIGSGNQWMSWIALDDVVGAIKFILNNNSVQGPVNIVAPNPVTNAEFTEQLGKALSRPTLLPIPGFGARLAFGEMADALLLSSQRVEPVRLKEAGYQFLESNLSGALRRVLGQHYQL